MAETSESNASLHDVFARSQQQFFEQWSKALETLQETLRTSDRSQESSEHARQVFTFYDSWREHTGRYLDVLLSACPGNPGTATFSKLFGAADAYARLYEFWEPLARALQERASNLDSYRDLLDPARFRETTDRIFGFGCARCSGRPFWAAPRSGSRRGAPKGRRSWAPGPKPCGSARKQPSPPLPVIPRPVWRPSAVSTRPSTDVRQGSEYAGRGEGSGTRRIAVEDHRQVRRLSRQER